MFENEKSVNPVQCSSSKRHEPLSLLYQSSEHTEPTICLQP